MGFGVEGAIVGRMGIWRTGRLLSLTCSILLAGNAAAPHAAQNTKWTESYRADSIKDIMDSLINPNANALWDSVASYIKANRIEDRAPRNDAEWRALRFKAITLRDATVLLLVPGRHVAKAGERSQNPEIELHPEQIEMLINADTAAWMNLARGLHDSTLLVLNAIDRKDVEALQVSGNAINRACEQCHQRYWYPNREKTLRERYHQQPD